MNDATLVILSIGTLVAVLILLLNALTELRDEIVNQGWVSERSILGRMTVRAQTAQISRLLKQLGFEDTHFEAVRSALDPIPRRARELGVEVYSRPDIYLLRRMKHWTYQLDPPYNFRGSDYYVDMMGLNYHRDRHQASLAQLFLAWISLLQHQDAFQPFDCIITPKDGNPILAREAADLGQKQLIICKGEEDKSRVQRPSGSLPHETDFEGLRAFVETRRWARRTPDHPYRIIALDDSCASGATLCSAVRRFNQFISLEANRSEFPFHPITDVVILFRFRASGLHNRSFVDQGLRLHAMVAVGQAELKFLNTSSEQAIVEDVARFKAEQFSCAQSLLLR